MREMKNSGIDWIGLIPKDWSVCKVKDIFFRKNEKANNPEPVVLSLARSGVKVRDITNGEGQLAENYSNYNPVSINDLLLNPMDLYSGANCSISKVEGVISPAYINLKAIGNNNSRYYDYYFKTQYWGMALFAHGKGVSFDNRWTLNAETLMNYYLPLPTTREQEKIANFLDEKISEIDNAIGKTKETIEEYKKLKKSVVLEIMINGLDETAELKNSFVDWIGNIPKHWIKCKIKTVCEVGSGTTPQSGNDLYYNETADNYWIQSGDIYGKKEIIDTKVMITKQALSDYSALKTYTSPYIVIAMYGGSVGNVAISKIDACTNQACGVLLPSSKVDINYLYYWLEVCKDDFLKTAEGGGQANISQDKIKNQFFLLCDLNEQKKIVNYLDSKCNEIDKLIESKEKIIDDLENYKRSVIYEYVTGKKEVK